MVSVAANVQQMAQTIRGLLADLLLTYSNIHEPSHIMGVVVFSPGGDRSWGELSGPGRLVQARVLSEYRDFKSILVALLSEQPADTLRVLDEKDLVITGAIQQDDTTWASSPREALQEAEQALTGQVELLLRLYDPASDDAVYVPDTNALLHNPSVEDWRFEGASRFALVLTATILSELDSLKVSHRNEDVRAKAERIIRSIKEYRRRGRLADGVPIVRGVSTLQTTATEPNFEKSLPWLRPDNNDDRFLASFIEVMRRRPHSSVTLVSRDINLQNKAEFARLPFVEPPDPKPSSVKS